jgi:hypothetical protein
MRIEFDNFVFIGIEKYWEKNALKQLSIFSHYVFYSENYCKGLASRTSLYISSCNTYKKDRIMKD